MTKNVKKKKKWRLYGAKQAARDALSGLFTTLNVRISVFGTE